MQDKLTDLKNRLKKMGPITVAFSGGVDSTFLLAVASEVSLDRLMAVTVKSVFVPEKEIMDAVRIAEKLGVQHCVVDVDVLSNEKLCFNPIDRCYHCKKTIFTAILDEMKCRKRDDCLVHAVNTDDLKDYRPGLKAAQELKVYSFLVEAGFSKADIRDASRRMGLETWNKPSQSCLATRLSYGEKITPENLTRIESAENFLHEKGFAQVRVRVCKDSARIEVEADFIKKLMDDSIRQTVWDALTDLGFKHVSVDMRGYRTGSMNQNL